MNTVLAINAALTLIEELLPQAEALVQSGQITPAQQQTMLDKYNSLKAKADGQFSGSAWQITP